VKKKKEKVEAESYKRRKKRKKKFVSEMFFNVFMFVGMKKIKEVELCCLK